MSGILNIGKQIYVHFSEGFPTSVTWAFEYTRDWNTADEEHSRQMVEGVLRSCGFNCRVLEIGRGKHQLSCMMADIIENYK